tara:strand:- start:482 stop:826 length:345 start_codon:yes stop_codon:yes gene_type:complete
LTIILYIYPGNLLGWLVYQDFKREPKFTGDFLEISSNHAFLFILLSFFCLKTYFDSKIKRNFALIYLIFLSIFLELLHIIVPERSFQLGDLFGNIFGVMLCFMFFIVYNQFKKI